MDKLDGRIDNAFFDRKAAEFRAAQSRLMCDIQAHQNANQSYFEQGFSWRTTPTRLKTKAARFCSFELPLEGRKAGS